MDPQTQFCHNPLCSARGIAGQHHIRIHSPKEQRYQCKRCRHTFTATTGTPFYRLRATLDLVTLVLTLLTHGCPRQAIVAAFGLDERTVATWQARAGTHAQAVHEHLVEAAQVDLGHVQADEMWVKQVGGRVWMALALAVPSRLWLGGVISARRDMPLIAALVAHVRAAAARLDFLVCVDGLSSYVRAFPQGLRMPLRRGRRGRPRLLVPAGLLLGQVIKRRVRRCLVSVERRAVRGTVAQIEAVLARTGTGSGINTAYIERLNATFRSALAPLARRSRALVRESRTLTAQMWLVGGAYNWCWEHDSLREVALVQARVRVVGRTPAMAAGLTDHRWTMAEFLRYQVPLAPYVVPKRRGRPPKLPTEAVAA